MYDVTTSNYLRDFWQEIETSLAKQLGSTKANKPSKRSGDLIIPLAGGSDIVVCGKPGQISLGKMTDWEYREELCLSMGALQCIVEIKGAMETYFIKGEKKHFRSILIEKNQKSLWIETSEKGLFFVQKEGHEVKSKVEFVSFTMFLNLVVALRTLLLVSECLDLEDIQFVEFLMEKLLKLPENGARQVVQKISSDNYKDKAEAREFFKAQIGTMTPKHQYLFVKCHARMISIYYMCHLLYNDWI